MDIEDSSVPYRAFLRSGSYPALSQRVVRSGGVLAQAAGWFALVVTAASGGYNLTQRFTPETAAATSESFVRPAARPAYASSLGAGLSSAAFNSTEVLPEGIANADVRPRGARAAAATAPSAAPDKALLAAPARKRTGAGAIAQIDATPEQGAPAQSEQNRASVAPERAAPDPIDAVLRDSVERRRIAAATGSGPTRAAAKPSLTPAQPERLATPATPSQPLLAAARVDNVVVRGPLSAAQLRRSVDRVRPTLSDCYGDAARRAGHNRFSHVRVAVTIDEAGRVKALPKVEGAQLPGFEACLSNAMSKLVCQAPDTGTAKASIVLGFGPER